jgi:N-acetylmuramoyl-L-alanine amidase
MFHTFVLLKYFTMAVFVSAGHTSKGNNQDSGAVNKNGIREADLTTEFRNLVLPNLKAKGLNVITDVDTERLAEYLQRIKTGAGSVVLEFHFDCADGKATGSTVIVGSDADRLDKAFAQEIVNVTSSTLGIKNRGVISEADSHRGRLGLMREQGTVALLEICFIDNDKDLSSYQNNKLELAARVADIIKKYEDLIS